MKIKGYAERAGVTELTKTPYYAKIGVSIEVNGITRSFGLLWTWRRFDADLPQYGISLRVRGCFAYTRSWVV